MFILILLLLKLFFIKDFRQVTMMVIAGVTGTLQGGVALEMLKNGLIHLLMVPHVMVVYLVLEQVKHWPLV